MDRKIEEASYLVSFDCHQSTCNFVHIAMHDRNGDPFAVASLDQEQTRAFIKHLQAVLYQKSVEQDACQKPN